VALAPASPLLMRQSKQQVAAPEHRGIGRGIVLISIAVMLFAIMDAISKYLTRFYPVSYILWVRFLIQTLAIIAVLGPRLGWRLVRTARPGIQILRGILQPLSSVCFILAIKYLPIAEASSITFISPMIVALLAVVFLREKFERKHWLAILAGFLGVLIIIRPGTGVFAWAALLPIGSAFTTAIYQVLTRRIAGLESVFTSIFYPGFIGLLAFSLTLPNTWTLPQSAWHLSLLMTAGLISASSHLILIKAFDYAPASRLAPFTYSQMVWATAMGYVVFGNFPDFWSLVGISILATGGIYLVTHLRR
jgi:drug/metabolite transporter (DMT)-like permease